MVDAKDKEAPERQPTQQELDKWVAEAEQARAEATRSLAEAKKAEAEARDATAKASMSEAQAEYTQLTLVREKERLNRARYADAYNDRTYRFLDPITPSVGAVFGMGAHEGSVQSCIKQLDAWHREDPTCEMTIVFDSPGGEVISGLHLFDHIRSLSAKGHRITTVCRGVAASMAAILLQAGDVRVMGPESHLMIHEIAFKVGGKIGDVEDTVEFAKKVQDRVLDIFARRCQDANKDTATRALTKMQLKKNWTRKDWWIDSKAALEYGLVDDVS